MILVNSGIVKTFYKIKETAFNFLYNHFLHQVIFLKPSPQSKNYYAEIRFQIKVGSGKREIITHIRHIHIIYTHIHICIHASQT